MSEKKISLIIVEDDLETLSLIKRELQEEYGKRLDIIEAVTYMEAITAIAGHRDETLMVISEYHFKDDRNTGIDVLNFAESVVTRAILFAFSAHDEDTVFADYSRTHHIQYFPESDLPKLKEAVGKALAKME